jgi:hypothetical protein
MINELVSSFFGKRSFSVSNVNNSLFGPGGLKNVLRDVAINGLLEGISGRTVDGSKITDSVNTSRSSNSKSTSAIIVERLPDIVETVYKRGTNTPYSPGVSQVIKDKFK